MKKEKLQEIINYQRELLEANRDKIDRAKEEVKRVGSIITEQPSKNPSIDSWIVERLTAIFNILNEEFDKDKDV